MPEDLTTIELPPAATAKEALRQMLESPSLKDGEGNAWLLLMHKHFTDRMLADTARIWQIGAIFVPVALAAFAPLVGIKGTVHWWQVLVLGLPSSGLLWLWVVIAENHRAFQQRSEAWLAAIEESRGLVARHAPNKYPKNELDRLATFGGAVQLARWALTVGASALWVVLFLLALNGKLVGAT